METKTLGSHVPETSESLVKWLIRSLTTRDFDEPQSYISREVYHKLIHAIIQRKDESIKPLFIMLEHDEAFVRNVAALALGRLQNREANERLMHQLQHDSSPDVQATVVDALYEIGDPAGIAIANEWRNQQRSNNEFVLRNRLSNFVSLGYTNRNFLKQLKELAVRYDVDLADIARSCLTYTNSERQQILAGNAAVLFGSVMITEEDYRTLQEIG